MTDTLDLVTALASQARIVGGPDTTLTSDEVHDFILAALAEADLDGRSVCL